MLQLAKTIGRGFSAGIGGLRASVTRSRDVDCVFRARAYDRSRDRLYRVHLPPGYRSAGALPVVMVLHGCEQDHDDIQRVSQFDRLADRHGFVVVYPFITRYSLPRHSNCWGFWLRSETQAGRGEVEDLWQILQEVQQKFHADESRLYVTGLSSGAAMAIALLVNRCDRIAAGASLAGVPYSERAFVVGKRRPRFKTMAGTLRSMNRQMGERKRPVPLMIVHAQRDPVVSVEAAQRTRNSWARAFDIDTAVTRSRDCGETDGIRWVHETFGPESAAAMLETLTLQDDRHGWFGGGDGPFGVAAGPDVAARMWRFFDAHRLAASDSPARRTSIRRARSA